MTTIHEDKFIHYKRGTAGSFTQSLFETYFKGDTENRKKLQSVFPELEVAYRYANESGYWQDLIKRYNEKYNNNFIG